jgi:hypothetical protein
MHQSKLLKKIKLIINNDNLKLSILKIRVLVQYKKLMIFHTIKINYKIKIKY